MLSGTAIPIHGLASNGGRILESGRKQWRILPGKRGLSGTSKVRTGPNRRHESCELPSQRKNRPVVQQVSTMFVNTIHLEKMRCLLKRKNLSFVASVQRGNFRRAKRHSFWNEDEIGPYNTGISNMEYALNFSSCLFMRATAMSRISTAVLLTSISHYWQCIFRRRLAVAMSGHPKLGRGCGMWT